MCIECFGRAQACRHFAEQVPRSMGDQRQPLLLADDPTRIPVQICLLSRLCGSLAHHVRAYVRAHVRACTPFRKQHRELRLTGRATAKGKQAALKHDKRRPSTSLLDTGRATAKKNTHTPSVPKVTTLLCESIVTWCVFSAQDPHRRVSHSTVAFTLDYRTDRLV